MSSDAQFVHFYRERPTRYEVWNQWCSHRPMSRQSHSSLSSHLVNLVWLRTWAPAQYLNHERRNLYSCEFFSSDCCWLLASGWDCVRRGSRACVGSLAEWIPHSSFCETLGYNRATAARSLCFVFHHLDPLILRVAPASLSSLPAGIAASFDLELICPSALQGLTCFNLNWIC